MLTLLFFVGWLKRGQSLESLGFGLAGIGMLDVICIGLIISSLK